MEQDEEQMEAPNIGAGEVWIWVEQPIASSKLTIVDELIDATVLKTEDAQLIARKANEDYNQYLWYPAACRERGAFVVRGERRDNPATRTG